MISISPEHLYSVFTCLSFLVLTLFWCCELWRQKNTIERGNKDKPKLFICDHCNLSFVSKTHQAYVYCPKCGEICFLPRRKRF